MKVFSRRRFVKCHVALLCLMLAVASVVARPARADFSAAGDIPDLHPEVAALIEQLWKAYQVNDYFKILALLQQTQDKAREVGDLAGEALIIFSRGEMARRLKQEEQAQKFEAEAREVMRSKDNRAVESRLLGTVGVAYRLLGQNQKALAFFQEALQTAKDAGDKSGQANALLLLGMLHRGPFHQPQSALEYMKQALIVSREAGDKASEAAALYRLAQIGERNAILIDNERVVPLEYAERALQMWRELGDKSGQVAALSLIGELYKDIHKKVAYAEDALVLLRAMQDERNKSGEQPNLLAIYNEQHSEVAVLIHLARNYDMLRDYPKSIEYLQRAIGMAKEMGNNILEATVLKHLALIYSYKVIQPDKARQVFKQTIEAFLLTGHQTGHAKALQDIAKFEQHQGNLDEAEARWREALELYEASRAAINAQSSDKIAALEEVFGAYSGFVKLLLQRGKVEEAFAWAEKTKGRALLELLHEGKADISRGLSAAERAQESKLQQHVINLNQRLVAETVRTRPNAIGIKNLKAELAQAANNLQTFYATLYAKRPDLAKKRVVKTVEAEELSQFLPEDTALLNYVRLGDAELSLFVATIEGGKPQIKNYPLNKANDELKELLEDFRTAAADPKKSYKSKARELYACLIAPAEQQLSGKKRLVLCPDGALWGIPFQALVDGEEFLLQRFEVSYAYSATTAQAALEIADAKAKQSTLPKTLLALANPDFGGAGRFGGEDESTPRPIPAMSRPIAASSRPISADARDIMRGDGSIQPLPGTQLEADAIGTEFPDAAIFTGEKAQESVVKAEGGKFRYLHFATHGLFNESAPLMSSLVLAKPAEGSSEDGFLTAREIFGLDWDADMVVLSACDTGRGQARAGEGVVGITWALFVAGASSQVVSQWAVNDASTAELMKRFYSHLKTDKGRAAALRAAELELLQSKEYSHPYYWAPFILLGDWRK